jgi:hypothetical protein
MAFTRDDNSSYEGRRHIEEEYDPRRAKEWPVKKQMVIDWRMPQDNQCVVLFDKVKQILVEDFEVHKNDEALRWIQQIKKLYSDILPEYKE